jgi:hypothetical protein
VSDEQLQKTELSIHRSRQSTPNVTIDSDRHRQKQWSPTFSTDDGMQIETSEQSSNA